MVIVKEFSRHNITWKLEEVKDFTSLTNKYALKWHDPRIDFWYLVDFVKDKDHAKKKIDEYYKAKIYMFK